MTRDESEIKEHVNEFYKSFIKYCLRLKELGVVGFKRKQRIRL